RPRSLAAARCPPTSVPAAAAPPAARAGPDLAGPPSPALDARGEGEEYLRAHHQQHEGEHVQGRCTEGPPAPVMDVVVDHNANAVGPVQNPQGQQDPVVDAPEGDRPPPCHEGVVDHLDAVDDVHDHDVA